MARLDGRCLLKEVIEVGQPFALGSFGVSAVETIVCRGDVPPGAEELLLVECRELGQAIESQEQFAVVADAARLDEVSAVISVDEKQYRIEDHEGRPRLTQQDADGVRKSFGDVFIGSQNIVVGAPLLFFSGDTAKLACHLRAVRRFVRR